MKENKNWKKQIALFLISQNLSMFGSSVVGFSIVWYITVTTESGFWITLSTLATLIPQVLVSLWAGVFADRYIKKRSSCWRTVLLLWRHFWLLWLFHYGFAKFKLFDLYRLSAFCRRSGFRLRQSTRSIRRLCHGSICSGSTVSTRWRIMCCCCFLRQPAALFWVCLGCSGLF